ncbi:TPA: signal peptidase I [Candidatus Woesearchaeota archaeon]|nr:signal peptidase I [Candidatus Woesearchaeota archaeon]
MNKMGMIRKQGKRVWHFLWKDDSAWSWVANVIVAFLVIRFVVYPVLGIVLGTSYPIVAVISESMEHGLHNDDLCGTKMDFFRESFDNYWDTCGGWYEQRNITKTGFQDFPFENGFDKGDVIILWRAHAQNVRVGDVLIFQGNRPQPIIHRVVRVWEENGKIYYQTKGDHNSDSITGQWGEIRINQDRIIGKGLIRIPYLGWIKILFVELVRPLGIVIER